MNSRRIIFLFFVTNWEKLWGLSCSWDILCAFFALDVFNFYTNRICTRFFCNKVGRNPYSPLLHVTVQPNQISWVLIYEEIGMSVLLLQYGPVFVGGSHKSQYWSKKKSSKKKMPIKLLPTHFGLRTFDLFHKKC